MMRMATAAIAAALSVSFAATEAPAATLYDLLLFNTDDYMEARISNDAVSGQLVATAFYPGNAQYTDITAFVRPGTNNLRITLDNYLGGWAYGYELRADGLIIAEGQCGVVGVIGCAKNDQTTGRMLDRVISFDVPVPAAAVPEPATWAMMVLGFGVAGGLMRRRVAAAAPTARANV